MRRRPPRSTPFPYATLSRSPTAPCAAIPPTGWRPSRSRTTTTTAPRAVASGRCLARPPSSAGSSATGAARPRSEEHTSELQSRQYLVCRLLLEKKNKDLRRSLAEPVDWVTAKVPRSAYLLRIFTAALTGNTTEDNRDLPPQVV